jgi:hypothetical protein
MKKLFVYSLLNLLNLVVWFLILFFSGRKIYITFMYLTILSYTLSMSYLIIILIYEARLHYHRHDSLKQEQIHQSRFFKFLKERIFKLVFQTSLTVCTGYWILCMGGENVMMLGSPIIMNLYVHLFIGLQVLVDLLWTHRDHLPEVYVFDFVLSMIGITIYHILLVYVAKTNDLYIYPFLKLEIVQILAIHILLCLISFNVYQFFHYIVEKRHKMTSDVSNTVGLL